MRNLVFFYGWLVLVTAGSADAATPVREVELTRRNDWVKASFEKPVSSPVTSPRSALGQGIPFSFTYGGRSSAELLPLWDRKEAARQLDEGRIERTITWTDAKSGLVLRCVAVEYRNFPMVEWTLYFKNSGAEDTLILSDILTLDAGFSRGSEGEFLLHHHAGSPATMEDYRPLQTLLKPKATLRLATAGGRGSDACWPYFNVDWGSEGAIVVVGWPGQWGATFSRDDGRGLRIQAGQEQTHFKLLPGEEVRSPLMVVQFWQGDWIRAQNVWRRWMVAYNLPRLDGRTPSALLSAGSSNQMNEMQNANEENQKQFIDGYVDEGVPINFWWMDAGWYPFKEGWWNTGTWEPDPKRFPNGLRAITDHAHRRGVKALVWFEPERVQPGTWLYLNHPEWLLGKDGDQKLLDLGNDAARTWVIEHTDQLLREQGIDIYRQDFNMAPLNYWRAHDAPDRQGISEIKHVTGYLAFWDELRRRHPGLLMDTCASGGRRNDLETLRRSVPLHKSDMDYGNLTSKQTQFYGLAFWEPFFGAPVYPADRVDVYGFRSGISMLTAMGYDSRRKELDYPLLRKLLAQREEVVANYYGDYYPLTEWSAELDAWMGWQFDRPEEGKGVVQVFRRPQSHYETARFKLRGLDPEAAYTLTNFDLPGSVVISGKELTEKGLLVAVPDQPGAVIISYSRSVGQPLPTSSPTPAPASSLRFRSAPGSAFEFDTGILRGVLRTGGKSLGLASVTHLPTGGRLDSSNGLLSHYRVFTKGLRYGGGAWDWLSEAKLASDGSVEVNWPAAAGRPFDLRATYRWLAGDLVEVETTVLAKSDLKSFESFLANYFGQSFTNAAVWAGASSGGTKEGALTPVLQEQGDWQMFPREPSVLDIIRDGRWKLPPNPVEWIVRPQFGLPVAVRKDPSTGLTAVLFGEATECFAIASPHQAEGHRSIYLSLFGRDLAAGQSATAKARLWITINPTEDQILRQCQAWSAPQK